MSKRYTDEFRADVVRVARNRRSGVTLVQIAEDFGISNASLNLWLRNAKIEEGLQPGVTQAQAEELRAANKRFNSALGLQRFPVVTGRCSPGTW